MLWLLPAAVVVFDVFVVVVFVAAVASVYHFRCCVAVVVVVDCGKWAFHWPPSWQVGFLVASEIF